MKSNNVDSGSEASTVDVALQCQHTSINNLIKSSVVETLFQLQLLLHLLGLLLQTSWKRWQPNPRSASSCQIALRGFVSYRWFVSSSFFFLFFKRKTTICGASHLLSRLFPPIIPPLLISYVPLCLRTLPSSSYWSGWTQIPRVQPLQTSGSIHKGVVLVWSLSGFFCLCLFRHFHPILFYRCGGGGASDWQVEVATAINAW